jgi:uncharacterized OB-fold protein
MSGEAVRAPYPDPTWAPAYPFWEGAARRELLLPRCTGCTTLNPAGELACRNCGAAELRWERMSGSARVYAWTVVRRAFLPEFAGEVPFITGLVTIAEDPTVRLVTRFVECDADDMRIDLPVTVVFEPLLGSNVLAPCFRPDP